LTLPHAQKVEYFLWAVNRARIQRDTACPACKAIHTRLLKRKYIVTSLLECQGCGLRFRTPKDDHEALEDFYQQSYSQGFTTDCPSDEALAALCSTNFAGCEKNFEDYVRVLNAIGLKSGDSILDFGASWGYGSWQLKCAGFEVFSYEISRPRAEYARTKLRCNILDSVDQLPQRVRCMFSSHVIEHLPNPNVIWEVANEVLTLDGVILCFCPNGDPGRELRVGTKQYHQTWGKVHPLLISPKFLRNTSERHGFSSNIYSTPYRLDMMRHRVDAQAIVGDELCMVASRLPQSSWN
jgi:2-polyprenyl-3-methyl-5-hydroxy-6-metoxy-1,4-benzoquinol methylase